MHRQGFFKNDRGPMLAIFFINLVDLVIRETVSIRQPSYFVGRLHNIECDMRDVKRTSSSKMRVGVVMSSWR
jgi:hypothetical protein